jgi:hypothetical protein
LRPGPCGGGGAEADREEGELEDNHEKQGGDKQGGKLKKLHPYPLNLNQRY